MCYKKNKPWIHVQNLEVTFYTKIWKNWILKKLITNLGNEFSMNKTFKVLTNLGSTILKNRSLEVGHERAKLAQKFENITLKLKKRHSHTMKTLKMKNPTKNCNNLASNIQQRKPCWTLLETLSNNDPQNMSH